MILYHFNFFSKHGEKYIKFGDWYFNKNNKVICSKNDKKLNNILKWIYNPFRKRYELYAMPYNNLDKENTNQTLVKTVESFFEVIEHCSYDTNVMRSHL